MMTVGDRQGVWVFLVERGLDQGSDLTLFWHEDAAIEAARQYLLAWWSPDELMTDDDVREPSRQRTNSLEMRSTSCSMPSRSRATSIHEARPTSGRDAGPAVNRSSSTTQPTPAVAGGVPAQLWQWPMTP